MLRPSIDGSAIYLYMLDRQQKLVTTTERKFCFYVPSLGSDSSLRCPDMLLYKIAISLFAIGIKCEFTHLVNRPEVPYNHGPPKLDGPETVEEAKDYLALLQRDYDLNTRKALESRPSSYCTMNSMGVRRAWDDLSEPERVDYIQAVHCMAHKPARTPQSEVPGVRNWIDDYVWQHIAQSNFIHASGLLLPWHRQFLASWERDLRNECGYKGYLPYWPWERHADNQSQSPLWQPSPRSFGTDGAYLKTGPIFEEFLGLPEPFNSTRAPGTGGGWVTDGAFGNQTGYTLNIGPVQPSNSTIFNTNNTPPYIYGQRYNPRPLRRDFLQAISTKMLNYTMLARLMMQDSIHTFHPMLENPDGVHVAGHYFIGGDAGDVYSSPNEPAFW